MTRPVLALAAVFFGMAAVFSSAAQACVSCEYVPEVAKKANEKPSPKRAERKRTPAVAKERAARPQKRIVKTPAPAKEDTPAQEEASKTVPADNPPESETSDASTAALADHDQAPAAEAPPKPEGARECKRFSATAGTTITVPCD